MNNNLESTTYIVGNNATPSAVQVVNDIPQTRPPPAQFVGDSSIIGSDHTLNQSLPVNYPSLDGNHVFHGSDITSSTPLPAIDSFSQGLPFLGIGTTPAAGFAGDNIDIDTGSVDLTSFAADDPNYPNFEIMATGGMRIWQSLNLTGMSAANDTVGLFAGSQMLIAPGSTLEADTGIFGLVAGSFGVLDTTTGLPETTYPDTLLDVSIYNDVGDVDVLSVSDLSIEGMNAAYTVDAAGSVGIESDGSLSLGYNYYDSLLDSGHNVAILAGGSVALTAGVNFTANDAEVDAEGGGVDIQVVNEADIVNSSYIYAGNGDINLTAGGNIYVDYSTLEASASFTPLESFSPGGSIYIAGGYVDIYESYLYSDYSTVNIISSGDMYLEYNDIESGYDSYGGNVTISATGQFSDYGSEIDAYNGDLDITAGGTADFEEDNLYADGNVNIESGDTLFLGWNDYGDNIEAGGTVNLKSDSGDVDAYDFNIYADSGDVNITAVHGAADIDYNWIYAYSGNVNIESYDTLTLEDDTEIYAYGGNGVSLTSSDSDVNVYNSFLHAYDGNVNIMATSTSGAIDIEDTYVSASGDVNIESGGTLTLSENNTVSVLEAPSVSISADGVVNLTSDNADVDIYNDYPIYAYGSDINGNGININAGGNVDSEYNYSIYAYYGGVSINAGSDVTLYYNDIYANDEEESEGGISINAGGDVNLSGNGIYNYEGGISIDAGGSISDYDNSIEADNGDLDITATGTADIEYDYLYASGNVNIKSGDTLYLGWYDDGDEIDANGVVNLTSNNGDVDIYDYEIYASGSDINGNGINISAGGNVDIEDSYDIYAYDGGVNISAPGSVYLYDDDIYVGADSTAANVDITSSGSTVDIDYTDLYAYNGDVYIESSDTLTVEDDSQIDAYGYNGISLTSDNADVDVYNSRLYAYYGSINISAAYNVDMENSYDIYANDNVNITSSSGSAPLGCGRGNVDINSSDIYAGYNIYYDYGYASYDGGSVNINAWNGHVDLYGDYFEAYSGAINDGDVNIYANGSVDVNDSELYADGIIYIESANTLTIENSSDLEAYNGDVTLTSDNADVGITDSEVYSDDGNVNISAAGSVYTSGANIEAGYDSDTGDVNINAYGGTADFENTDIEAAGGVYIESSDTLTLNYTAPNDDDDNYSEVYADGGPVNLKSDYGDVNINNYDIYGYGGDVNISAGFGPILSAGPAVGGNVDIQNTEFDLYSGSVNINATGNVAVDYSYFNMYYGGDITVNAGGNIDTLYTDGYGTGSISLTAGGYVNVYDYEVNLPSLDVTAGTSATLGADEYVDIYNGTITANGGNVDITGNTAGADIDNSTITASGEVNITAGGGIGYGESRSGSQHGVSSHVAGVDVVPSDHIVVVPPSFVSGHVDADRPLLAAQYVVLGTFTPETFVEPGPISPPIDYINDEGISTEIAGTLDSEANIDAYVYNSSLVSDGGDVMVDSAGTGEVDSSYIEANGSVYLTAVGSLTLSGSAYENELYADNGDVDIQSSGSTVGIDNTYIYANGSVHIESGDTLTVGFNGGDSIEAYNGGVSLTSDNADVDIYDYSIYSDYGNVNISAAGNVYLSGDDIYSGYDSDAGDVNIQALSGTVDLEGNYISAAGNVGVYSYSTLTLGSSSGDTIDSSGWANLSSTTGDVDIYNTYIYTYGSDVDANGLTIAAAAGNVNIENSYDIYAYYGGLTIAAYGSVYLYNDEIYAGWDSDTGNMNINSSGSTVAIDATYLYAEGDVNIESSGTLTVENSSEVESYGNNGITLTSDNADVDVTYSSLYAYNGDVNITANSTSAAIDLDDAYLYAEGNVNIESSTTLTVENSSEIQSYGYNGISLTSDNADVDVSYSSLYAYDGDIDFTAISTSAAIDLDDAYLYAEGDVNIESSTTLTVENSSEIQSYGYNGISLTSDNADVDVYDSSLYAYNGDVNIMALGTGASIDLENTYISANGNVNIESSGTLALGNYSGWTIEAGGTINLTSDNGDVDIYSDYELDADGSDYYGNGINISAGGSVDIEDDYDIYADYGGVSINAAGSVYLYDDDIYAGNYTTYGNMNITSSGSTVDIDDSYLYAAGDVYVVSSDTLTLENNAEIESYGNNGISLTSNNGAVDVYDTSLYAYYGDVDITATSTSATIDLENNYITAYGNVNIESSSTLQLGNIETGGNTIYAGSGIYLTSDTADVDIYNSTIDGGYFYGDTGTVDDITIADGSTISGDSVNLNAYGTTVSITAAGNVDIEYTDIDPGGGINISSSSITSGAGTTGIGGVSIYSDGYIYVGGYSDTLYQDYIVGNNISVNGATITANGGGVSIVNDAYFSSADTSSFGVESSTVMYGDIAISGGTTITANGGTVDIETSGNSDLVQNSSIYGSSLSVNDISIYDSTITANGGDVIISAGGYLTTGTSDDVTISASGDVCLWGALGATVDYTSATAGGKLDLNSDGFVDTFRSGFTAGNGASVADANINSYDSAIDLESTSVNATGNVNVNAATSDTVNNSTLESSGGSVTVASTTGQTTIEGSSTVQAVTYLSVNSPDGILLDGTSGHFSGNTLNLTSGNLAQSDTIQVLHADLSGFAAINISGNTLDIENTDFGYGTVNLGSQSGTVNVNNGVIAFEANLISDRWGGNNITTAAQVASGIGTTPGMYSHSIP